MPSSLGSRSFIVVGRQTKILQLAKFLKFEDFNLKARLGCLNGFMALVALYE